jgi:hypothetical protein
MSLTTALPIFPGLKPGQSFAAPPAYLRYSTWNYKEGQKWNNSRQQAINGRLSVVKYWPNALWDWEWTYGILGDDPSGAAYGLGLNPVYPQPIPSTDYGMLKAFYAAGQGATQFAYQPPDYQVGGNMTVSAVSGSNDLFQLFGANTAQDGQIASIGTLTGATFLNGQNLTILACSPTWIMVYFVHGDYALTGDSGTVFCGQLLSPADANNNSELVHTLGAYPTLPLTGTPPAYTLVTESVQLIDSSTLTVKAAGASPGGYSLQAADTIAPYQGLVINFASTPTPPVTASFSYYYPAMFSEDTQEYENFMALLTSCSSVRFEQWRL